jgi:hypothetical protein
VVVPEAAVGQQQLGSGWFEDEALRGPALEQARAAATVGHPPGSLSGGRQLVGDLLQQARELIGGDLAGRMLEPSVHC